MKRYYLLVFCLLVSLTSFGQVHTYVAADDFKNVNTNYFVTSATLPINDNEVKYLLSSMRIAEQIRSVFAAPVPTSGLPFLQGYTATNFPAVAPKFVLYKLNGGYTNWSGLSLISQDITPDIVIIRPNDNTIRPCIMLTNGSGEDLRANWTGTLYSAASLVMRGYAVAIYENGAAGNGLAWTQIIPNSSLNVFNALSDDNKYRAYMYGSVQCGTAALQFLTDPGVTSVLKINTSKIYSAGGSWGGLSSTIFTYADDNLSTGNLNFAGNLFRGQPNSGGLGMGNFTRFSRWPASQYRNMIKSVACLGGGSSFSDPIIGNVFDTNDKSPVLFLHAINDALVNVLTGAPIVPGSIQTTLGGPANPQLLQALVDNSIKFNAFVNCDPSSEHVFASGFGGIGTCNANGLPYYFDLLSLSDADIVTRLNAHTDVVFMGKLKQYIYLGLQVLDMNTYISTFFFNSTNGLGITTNTVKYVKPTEARTAPMNCDFFPATVIMPNGHFTNSPGCQAFQLPNGTIISGSPLKMIVPEIGSAIDDEVLISIDLFPNPTSGNSKIVFSTESSTDLPLEILNLQGTQVHKSILPAGRITHELDLDGFPAGIYFVRMQHADGHFTTQKLVKQ